MKARFLIGCVLLVISACSTDSRPSADRSVQQKFDYDTSLWAEILPLPGKLIIDLQYATSNTPTGEALYECPRCFLTKEAAHGFQGMLKKINEDGYIVKIWDCYRPKSVHDQLLERATEIGYKRNNMRGPMHARGLAIDITLCDLEGKALDMGSSFDEKGKTASHIYMGLSPEVMERRKYLLSTTREFGFQAIRDEWWHYNYRFTSAVMQNFLWPCN